MGAQDPPVPARERLASFVSRATEANIPVAVVDLHGPGQKFQPSRGEPGARYEPQEYTARDLAENASGAPFTNLALYPPPDPDVKRVIVLPMEGRNWLRYDESLERTLTELLKEQRAR